MEASIVPYDDTVHRGPVADLWRSVFGYDAPHNHPERAIAKKLAGTTTTCRYPFF